MPAIAVTSYVDDLHQERAIAAGYDEYLAKPVDSGRLVELVSDVLRRKSPLSA
jgi:CheY-like chemotaxis protein